MENGDNEAIASFDTLYTNNHIQMLKVLLPYFDAAIQKKLAIMIKYLEFQYTMDYFRKHPKALGAASVSDAKSGPPKWDIVRIFTQIKNFCTPSERAMFEQLAALKKNMEMYEEMVNMMQLFSEFAPAGGGMDGGTDARTDGGRGCRADSGPSGADVEQDFGPMDAASMDFNPMDMLKNMLSPEQQAMFQMFQSTLSPAQEPPSDRNEAQKE